jgi:hypothetical protein
MAIIQKSMYRFNQCPLSPDVNFQSLIETSEIKLVWKHKKPQIAKVILSKKSNVRGIVMNFSTKLVAFLI